MAESEHRLAYKREYYQRLRSRRRDNNRCVRCGGDPEKESTLCAKCHAHRQETTAERNEQRKQSGVCTQCGKRPLKTSIRCEKCAQEKAREFQRRCARGIIFSSRISTLRIRHPNEDVATAKEIGMIFELQGGRCFFTGLPLTSETAELDHIIPRSRGGSGTRNNLRWVHKTVNRMRGAMTDDEFIEWVGRIFFSDMRNPLPIQQSQAPEGSAQ